MHKNLLKITGALSAVIGLLAAPVAQADSMRSECGFSDAKAQRPDTTSSCMFSQRQGYISIRIDGGSEFELSPQGDAPGNYLDQQGKAVYRLSGLGEEGQLFKLTDSYLFVFWNPSRTACTQEAMTAPSQCQLNYGANGFEVQASAGSSINQLSIKPKGLASGNEELVDELDGSAYGAELADLDGNGWPEIYVYVASAGSGSYGSLVAYAVNAGKSVTPIYLPSMEDSPETVAGYMGHDQFAVVENRLVRRFPVYLENDTNAAASGGTRQLQYRLEPGEAGWLLRLDRVVDY
jgi:hypothetical protein